ncbi:hypothetical protein BN1708_006055 [Verticillium longisporum]|uniref:Uncharacterized protein n=1 Tax=Verticillium longisporum TaxID=100787 RepID=A0A0G4MH13_VERLO|nr:hypothetical protein BN1708_006055 [Verticillium longisporum]
MKTQDLLPSAFLSSFYPQWVSDSYHRGRLLHWSLREARQVTLGVSRSSSHPHNGTLFGSTLVRQIYATEISFGLSASCLRGKGKPALPKLLQSLKQRHEPEPVPLSHTPELAESRERFLFRHRAVGSPFEASVLPRGWLWLSLTRADSRGRSADAHPTPEWAWGLSLMFNSPANGAFQNVPGERQMQVTHLTKCDVYETAENPSFAKWNRSGRTEQRRSVQCLFLSTESKTRSQLTVRFAGIAQTINGVHHEGDDRCHSASAGFTLEIAENHTTPDA